MRGLVGVLLITIAAACSGRMVPPAAVSRPLLILVSIDGWRWDYDTRAPAPNVRSLVARGVVAAGLIPSHPSKTVPNHYTMVTGLYPGRHGMIANVIRDPATGRLFERTNRAEVEDPMWWGGDPIWNLAQRRGIFAATMFWPGSEAPVGGMRPRFWREYDDLLPGDARVDQVLSWLDLPDEERPGFITLYLNEVDVLGHWYGPDSSQVYAAIGRADQQLGRLLDGLRRRGLAATTNLVVVSDHGMAPTTRAQTIVVEDLVAAGDIDVADINPTLGVTPAAGADARVAAALIGAHPRLRMYRREDTPAHWRFRENPRIPPLTGVADEGWVVLRRGQVDEYWKRSDTGGQHGYDPQLQSMRGIFIAAGPSFRQATVIPAFENVHIYNLLALALDLPPRPNDGDPAIARSILK